MALLSDVTGIGNIGLAGIPTTVLGTATTITGPIDINAGTIDGTVIGGSTAAAGSFTTVTADGLTVDGNTQVNSASAAASGTRSIQFYRDSAERGAVRFDYSASAMELQADGSFFVSTGGEGTSLFINGSTRDISFYDTAGTTPKFFWDASAESLGIGTSSPTSGLELEGVGNATNVTLDNTTGTTGRSYSIRSGNTGNLDFYDNDATTARLVIDSAGNVGIGVTPENSAGTWRNFEVGGANLSHRYGGANDAMLGTGFVFKTDNSEVYKNSEAVSRLFFNNNDMSFQQAGSGTAGNAISWTTAAKIDASGNLLVGTTTPAPNSSTTIKGTLGLVGLSTGSTSNIKFNNSANIKYWSIDTDTTNFYIADADFSHYGYLGQTMTAWAFGSDRRLKESIVDVPYGLNAVMAMQPRAFKFKSSGVETIGFVAQELQAVVPEAVSGTEVEYLDSDTPQEKANKSLGVSQDTLIPVLVKAMQEQQAIIEALTARLEALEGA